MTWQRGARAVVVVVGLSCAVALWALRRDPPPSTVPVTLRPADAEATAEGGAASRILYDGSSTRARWQVESWTRYANPDRMVGVKNHIQFEAEGLELWADEAETLGTETSTAPREIKLLGNVRIRTSDGLEVTTPSATYDSASEIILMPEAVRFTKGRMTGTGVGGHYDRRQELFLLQDQAHVVVTPEADGSGALDVTSKRLTTARVEKFTRLDEQAVIVTSTETIKGDTATLYFTDDEQHLKLVDLQGHASVEPAPPAEGAAPAMPARGGGAAPEQRPGTGSRSTLRGDQISLTFQPTGNVLSRSTATGSATATLPGEAGARTIAAPWIDIALGADGATVLGIDAKPEVTVTLPAGADAPERVISAGTLAARGAEGKGLQNARFDASPGSLVRFTERRGGRGTDQTPTTARSRVLLLALDGALDAMTQAEFRQQVTFDSAGSQARGEWAVYRTDRETLRLTRQAADSATPSVTQDDLWVSAPDLTLGVQSQDLDARGGVATRLQPGGKRERRSASLFDERRAVVGAADTMTYVGATRLARYAGNAELRQDDGSFVAGEVVVVDDAKGVLTATTGVRTRFTASEGVDGAGATPAARVYVATSDAFEYTDETRRAIHRGAPARVESEGRLVEAGRIEMFLAQESKTLERLLATADERAPAAGPRQVYAMLDRDHEARGDRLDYTAATNVYVLTGKPVEVVAPSSEGQGCFKTIGVLAHFNRASRQVSWPPLPDGRDQGVRTEPWTCGKSIR